MAGEGSLVELSFWSDMRGSLTLGTMVWGVLVLGAGLCLRVGIEDRGLSFWPGTSCSLTGGGSSGVVTLVGGVSGVVIEFDAFSDSITSPLSAELTVCSFSV